MFQFGLKDLLRGVTLGSIGLGMLAIAFRGDTNPASELTLGHAFLVAFGGMLIGYGFAFAVKWPPYQMIFAMVGMFAAQAWQSGSSLGLVVYLGLLALFHSCRLVFGKRRVADDSPSAALASEDRISRSADEQSKS